MGTPKLKISHVTLTTFTGRRPSWHLKVNTWYSLSVCIQTLTTIASAGPEIRRKTYNVNIGVVCCDLGHGVRLPITFHRNNTSILLFSIYRKLFVESRKFYNQVCLGRPLGWTYWIFINFFWYQKIRFPGLSCSVVWMIMHLAVTTELRLVTDRQTDRQTDRRTDTMS